MDQRPHPSGTAAGQGSIQHTSRIKLFWHWLFVISVISKKNVCEHWLQLCSHFGWLHSVPCLPLLFPVCFLSQLSCMAIRCDVWQQPMDFIFTTPPSTAMTCYDYCIYNHIVYMYFVVPHALHTIPSTININQALLSSSLSLPSPGWQRPMATRQCPAAIWRPSSVTWTADTFAPCRRRWRSSCATFEAGSWRFGRCLGWMVLRWF